MSDEPVLAPVIELPTSTKASIVRRCSACRQPGHRVDSASCPKRDQAQTPTKDQVRRPIVSPGPMVDRLTREIDALDTYIADHELALDTIEQRLADASKRRDELVRALEAAQTLDGLYAKETTP